MDRDPLLYGRAPILADTQNRGRAQLDERRERERAVRDAGSRPLTQSQKAMAAEIGAGRAAEQADEKLRAFRMAVDARHAAAVATDDPSTG